MRITCVASPAPEFEVDAFLLPYARHVLEYGLSAVRAELGLVILRLVDILGRIRHQVEGVPCGRKGIVGVRVLLLVLRNALFQTLLAYVAPPESAC